MIFEAFLLGEQLRKVLNVKYPVRMRNRKVYEITQEEMLSIDLLRSRWRLFGHVLRMDEEAPAFKSMLHYYSSSKAPKFRGRPRVNLPWKLDQDLGKFCTDGLQLKSLDDLRRLEVVAHDRKKWKNLVETMCVVAKAEKNF